MSAILKNGHHFGFPNDQLSRYDAKKEFMMYINVFDIKIDKIEPIEQVLFINKILGNINVSHLGFSNGQLS